MQNITNTSVWCGEGAETKIALVTMYAMANKSGQVIASVQEIAKAARIPESEVAKAITRFCAPDRDNINSANIDGRIIEEIPGGWQIIPSPRERRNTYQKALMRKRRAEGKA